MNAAMLMPGRRTVQVVNATGVGLMSTCSAVMLLQALGSVQLMFSAWLLAILGILGLVLMVAAHARAFVIEQEEHARLADKDKRTSTLVRNATSTNFILNHAVQVLMYRAGLRSITFGNDDFIKIAGMGQPMLFETPFDNTYTVVVREPFNSGQQQAPPVE